MTRECGKKIGATYGSFHNHLIKVSGGLGLMAYIAFSVVHFYFYIFLSCLFVAELQRGKRASGAHWVEISGLGISGLRISGLDKVDKIIPSNVVKQRKRGLEEGREIPEKMAQKTAELFVIK